MSPLPIPVFVVVNKAGPLPPPSPPPPLRTVTKSRLLRSAYPAVPLASVLCINICLHQWLYCTDREAEREEDYAPIGACAIVFFSSERGSAVTLWPTSRLGSTHPALNVLPLSHHASSCPTSLLLCRQPLFVLSLCFFPSLCGSLILTPLMFSSPLQPSSLCSFSLSVCPSFAFCPPLSALL